MKATPLAALLCALSLCACSHEEPVSSTAKPKVIEEPVPQKAALAVPPKPAAKQFIATEPAAQIEIGARPALAWSDLSIGTLPRDEGVVVELFAMGKGAVVKKYSRVSVHYQGWVKGVEETFDSTMQSDEPISFPVGIGAVIDGWDESFLGMTVGTRARLHIPAKMGYGEKESSSIPAGSDLVFDVLLLDLVKK